jgi:hypothetical protein
MTHLKRASKDAADSVLSADWLVHLGAGGHVGRAELGDRYFRPVASPWPVRRVPTAAAGQLCEREPLNCQHRIPPS